jgi:hypothetical protein
MDRKTFSIGILSLTAVILFVATLFPAKPAHADFAVKDLRGIQMVTVANQAGGDVLYIIEPQSAKILVLAYNPTTRDLRTVAMGDLNAAFGGGR